MNLFELFALDEVKWELSPTLVQDVLAAVPETEEIWLHGSRATGKQKRTSDTDILVIIPSTTIGDEYLNTVRKLQQLSAQYDNYDIQPSHPTNNIALIAREEGKCLFKKTNEVIYHNNIKPKNQDSSGLVNRGEPVPQGKEKRLLGNLVGKIGAYEVYKWDEGTDSAYSVYDPKTRISQMTISGHNKPHSFEIFGIYAGPQAPIKASDLYAWLVKDQGLTLVSDKYQSPGGQRVWQDLEQRYGRSVNVYAFNMKTNKPINTGADDPESTHGHRGDIAQNVRLVASPK